MTLRFLVQVSFSSAAIPAVADAAALCAGAACGITAPRTNLITAKAHRRQASSLIRQIYCAVPTSFPSGSPKLSHPAAVSVSRAMLWALWALWEWSRVERCRDGVMELQGRRKQGQKE